MKPIDAYKFCPRCGGSLFLNKEKILKCQKCGFSFYINSIPCNAAIIENENGEILLVKRKYDPKKGYWDWPGGFLNTGESLFDSVKREIKEELGVDIKIEKLIGAYTDTYLFQKINNPIICIVVSAKIIGGKINASDDISGFQFFPKDKILKQIFAFPSIKQGISDYLSSFE